MMMQNLGECYYDHFERFFRSPKDRRVFEQDKDSPSVQILSFEDVYPGCRLFASLGLSRYADELGQVCEVIAPVDDAWDDIPFLLANSLFYLIQQRMKFGWGIAINVENIAGRFTKEYAKSALYLTNPFGLPSEASEVLCGGRRGRVYFGLFISKAEFEYFQANGAVLFERLLEAKSVDPFHLRRASLL